LLDLGDGRWLLLDSPGQFGFGPAADQASPLYLVYVVSHGFRLSMEHGTMSTHKLIFLYKNPGVSYYPEIMNIGDRLRLLRTRCGLSIEDAAELSGYSAPQIKKIEGGYSPSVVCLNSILRAYGTNLPQFFQSAAGSVSEERREVIDKLHFILDEAEQPDASTDAKERAAWIQGNVKVFYRDTIRDSTPIRVKKKIERRPAKEKKHGPYLSGLGEPQKKSEEKLITVARSRAESE
jgi:transcriptional regulator with XRE-family HTH domain